jgi:hypothetical protein
MRVCSDHFSYVGGEAVHLFVGCDKRSEFQSGVPARAIIEVRGRPRSS